MDNVSFEQERGGETSTINTQPETAGTMNPDKSNAVTISESSGREEDLTLPPITEEDRLRQQIETYKEMIKNLESSPSRDAAGNGAGDMYPTSSRSRLNAAPSTSSLTNTLSDCPTMDLRNQRHRPNRKDLPADYGTDVVLLNTFRVGRKRYSVYLNDGKLIWEKERRGDTLKDIAIPDSRATPSYHRQIVPLEDILCVRSIGKQRRVATPTGGCDTQEILGSEEETAFQLHYARRRSRNANIWKNAAIKFQNPDSRIVAKWVSTLRDILSMSQSRPRHILMFVNPYGGKRIAMDIYNKVAKPLLQLAGIDVSLVVTQRQNQVTDIIMNNYLEQYDGIVCCGGDGTFNELYNGIVRREIIQQGTSEKRLMDLELPRPNIPIGVIPGGSTNTISYCLNGTDDVKTAVLNIALGKVDGMDLSSVHRNSGNRELLRLYASVMSYGFLGDVSKEAEEYRSLGPKRYDYVGVKRFLKNAGYEAEIKILLDDDAELGVDKDAGTERRKCLEGCERCSIAVAATNVRDSRGMLEELRALENNDEGRPRWKVVRGKFFMVSGANISCACHRSPQGLSPYCHIGDGCLDLILVNHSSFLNNLRLASRLSASGQHISSLPFIDTYRTRAFTFSVPSTGSGGGAHGPTTEEPSINASTVPITQSEISVNGAPKKSSWNCDGEVIEETELIVRTHCQLVQVFRSGIQDKGNKKDCCGVC